MTAIISGPIRKRYRNLSRTVASTRCNRSAYESNTHLLPAETRNGFAAGIFFGSGCMSGRTALRDPENWLISSQKGLVSGR